MLRRPDQFPAQRLQLLRIGDLFHPSEIHRAAADHESVRPQNLGLRSPAVSAAEFRTGLRAAAGSGFPDAPVFSAFRLSRFCFYAVFREDFPDFFCHIPGNVLVHLDDPVRHPEEITGTAGNQHRGDPLRTQSTHPAQIRDDRLLLRGHDPLHQTVPHHEIGGTGVFVHEQAPGSGCDGFHTGRRLGGAAAGILGGKVRRGFPIRQTADEETDVIPVHTPSVLGPDLYGSPVGDDELPSVSGNMIVDAPFQCIQQGGLAVVAASDDQRDARRNAHARDGAPVGQFENDPVLLRGAKRHRILHRSLGNTALPGQHRTVGDEGHQSRAAHLIPERFLVVRQIADGLQLLRRETGEQE